MRSEGCSLHSRLRKTSDRQCTFLQSRARVGPAECRLRTSSAKARQNEAAKSSACVPLRSSRCCSNGKRGLVAEEAGEDILLRLLTALEFVHDASVVHHVESIGQCQHLR